MPKRQEYEADDGFVEDAPESKKRRSAGNELKRAEGKTTVSTEMQEDEDGNEMWEISKTRRVQISNYKGNTMISIREYYEKDGKMLPGKKGISLTLDQFTAVIDILPQVESVLKSKGLDVPRPNYGTSADVTGKAEPADEEDEEEEVDEKPPKGSKRRANHEATDDDEE